MVKGKSVAETVTHKRVNLKLKMSLHKRLRKICKEKGQTLQRGIAELLKQYVELE